MTSGEKAFKRKFLTGLIAIGILLSSATSIQVVSGQGDNVTLITENTVHEGDLTLDGNATLKIVGCFFSVTGTTVLRDQAKLVLLNATLDTNGLTLYDFSGLKVDSSIYSWGIKAYGYSTISVTNSSFLSTYRGQLIELSGAASLSMYNSTSENMLIRLLEMADATVYGSGPAISIQTGVDASTVSIVNSMIPFLGVYGNSVVEAVNSSLGEVVVAHSGALTADGCLITGSLGYFDYHATVRLSNSFVASLIDGLIYRDEEVSLIGEDIILSNYTMGVENINSTVIDKKYVLYLLGEKGRYRLVDLTPKVVKVLVEASEVTAESINLDDLVFFVGGNGVLIVEDSNFDRILAMTTLVIDIKNCRLGRIDFTNDIITVLWIVNSTIVSDEGSAVSGGWSTDVLIESSNIYSPEGSPEISIDYLNALVFRNVSDVVLTGMMGVSAMVYDSKVNFSKIVIDRVYNDLNSSEIRFIDGAMYDTYLSRPSRFVFHGLEITPKRVEPGGVVDIQAMVENEGDLSGTEYVELMLDGDVVDGYEVTLEGGKSKELSFQLTSEDMGKHVVELGGVSGYLFVVDPNSLGEILRRHGLWFALIILIIVIFLFTKKYLIK